jgi:hypothetical protein
MTETELLRSIKDDFRSVTDSVNGLGREISSMSSTLAAVCQDVRDHEEKISEISKLELTCPARAREVTGAIDTRTRGAQSLAPKSSTPSSVALLVKLAPWILFLGVSVGAFLAANGEAKASAQAIKDLAASVAAVQRAVNVVP